MSIFAVLVALAPAVCAQANNSPYLALGDSIAFGLDPNIPPDGNPDQYVGYPKLVAQGVNNVLVNASCPGEASGSFLDASAPDLGVITPQLGCRFWKDNHLLFVDYSGTQIDFAVDYLKANRNTKLVTINIGGNDLALLQAECGGNLNCVFLKLPGTLARFAQNLSRIYSRIRSGANYRGKMVALTYYAFDYRDLPTVSAFIALNTVISTISTAYNVRVADGFQAFNIASAPFGGDACAAGLLLRETPPLPGSECGSHPTLKGQQLLADTILRVLK